VRGSIDEQALLVEGLLNIEVSDRDGSSFHHPVQTLLRLVAHRPSSNRAGLELALEPTDDSEAEVNRVIALYDLDADARQDALGISDAQRANAVKIFPRLAVTAGLIVEERGLLSLSQDGWAVLGRSPVQALRRISSRRGRRTTVGRIVTTATVASRRVVTPPRGLSLAEQRRAAGRLADRTNAHQDIVREISAIIGDEHGVQFEDPFSYDLLWVPTDSSQSALLFEIKTIINVTDAYARVKDAVGQLSYYDYFYVSPTLPGRSIQRVAVFNSDVTQELIDYMSNEQVGVIFIDVAHQHIDAANLQGQLALDALPGMQVSS
jgi:hypothetical protein